ncbi:hypothetical protein M9H77_21411 [Catharanthus roseus]|uniref:Uncharacterized protein n=1 Tax=Catharanthus roseus TaxID=4058 RepID=A0ACC0AQ68_CATRO|nr:hypothetical protein M9H77_21411 [Catharanthus roseus]
MEAINPIRVMLCWDSEIARDAYSPYFTGVVRKSWTLPMTRMISHNELTIPPYLAKEGFHIFVEFEHIQQQNIPITHDINTTTLTELLQRIVNNDDDEVDGSDGDDVISSQSESDDDNNPKEGEFQTPLNLVNPVNPVTENILP